MQKIEFSNEEHTLFFTEDGEILTYNKKLQSIVLKKLEKWRNDKAYKAISTTDYIIENYCIMGITMFLPTNYNMLLLINGLTLSKVEYYGKDIVNIINAFFSEYKISKVIYGYNALTFITKKKVIGNYLVIPEYSIHEKIKIDINKPKTTIINNKELTENIKTNDNKPTNITKPNINKIIDAHAIVTIEFENENEIEKNIILLEVKKIRPIWVAGKRTPQGSEVKIETEPNPVNDAYGIPYSSPLAQALLGKTEGDTTSYKVGKKIFNIKILNVEYRPNIK